MGWLTVATIIYGLLMAAGGVAGYATAKSQASLMSGVASGVAMIIFGLIGRSNPAVGFGAATFVVVVLCAVFLKRSIASQWHIRNVGLLCLSLVMLATLIYGHLTSKSS